MSTAPLADRSSTRTNRESGAGSRGPGSRGAVGTGGLLAGLNEAQHAAVVSTAAPLVLLAGAGSGKTRVLTRRIAYRIAEGTADPSRVLALTFTRKAAGELTKRLGQLGVQQRIASGTFHAVAYSQLRQWWTDTRQSAPALVTSKTRLVAPLVYARKSTAVQPFDVVSEIEWAKARLLTPETYATEAARLVRTPPLGVGPFVDIFRRYESEKQRRGVVDFDDLLTLCGQAMATDREFAARQRWQFRHLFVDEFQDVNPAQYRLLECWLGLESAMSGGYGAEGSGLAPGPADRAVDSPVDLCVVGDPNQAIYAWNGADPAFLTGFTQRFRTAEAIRLEDNYRSSPEILTVADAVLGNGVRASRALRPNRPNGSVPTITEYPSDLEEARGIARQLRDAYSPMRPWSSMAILTRTNAQSLLFEEALRSAGIPHRVRGGGAFLAQPEIASALGDLRRIAPTAPFSERIADLEELVAEARAAGRTGAEGTNDRVGTLEGLVRLGHEFLGIEPMGTCGGFVQWVGGVITSRADEPDRGGNLVEIATFHRSKGLEWPIVFVAGLERGFVPIGQADNQDAWDEERRLLYVAVTRAEQELHCSWARTRTFGSRTTQRTESPWLTNIAAARAACTAPDGGDWRVHLKALRDRQEAARAAGVPGIRGEKYARIQIGTKADPGLFEALKKWRADKARATGVPAFVICHDTTLAAVAEARPISRVQLLQVPGFGPVKADRYGEDLLGVVAQHRASA
jgi:DNA helicase II / ATP-dependent DNA helicase PcrA